MNFTARVQARRSAWCLVLGALSWTASAALPQGEFACKVVTASGQQGVVLVQADTRDLAARAAAGAEAFTFDNGRSRATSVVQCIDRSAEQFSDYQFQQFFEQLAL